MFQALPRRVKIVEVGPRDGLQNEATPVATADKVRLIELLGEAGLAHIEMTSFVNPRWIPSLADGPEVAAAVRRKPGVEYSALVPNLRGYECARQASLDLVAFFLSASETHNQKNLNQSREAALAGYRALAERARGEGQRVRAYISTVFGCPYEGEVAVGETIAIARQLLEMGIEEVSLGDTTGIATPRQVQDYLTEIFKALPPGRFACHFHDTRGTALANTLVALECGVTTFDSSVGGLGGCPYAPGATGNVATDDLVYLLESLGVDTGIDGQKLLAVTRWICREVLKTDIPSRYARAELARQDQLARSNP